MKGPLHYGNLSSETTGDSKMRFYRRDVSALICGRPDKMHDTVTACMVLLLHAWA